MPALTSVRTALRRIGAVAALCLAATTVQAQTTTYQWNGTTDTTFGTAANWSVAGVLPVNGAPTPIDARLNVLANPNTLTYSAAQGSTILSNSTGRGLVLASGNQGTLNITGGTLSTQGSTNLDVIGNSQTGAGGANFNVSGGTFIGAASGTAMGAGLGPGSGPGGNGTVNISGSGLVKVTSFVLANLTNCTVNLNGGTLEANNVTNISYNLAFAPTNYSATFRFNGGTLKARQNDTRFLQLVSYNYVPLINPAVVATAYITNGGAIIDSSGFNVTIPTALVGEGASTGGLTKNGGGILTLGGTNTYTGATVVNQGGLSMALPSSSGALVLAAGTSNNLAINGTNWNLASAALTNTTLGFNFGLYNGNPAAVLNVTNLAISGSVTCNISGLAIPVGNLTLVSYASGPHPGGNFVLGSLPSGMVATLNDNGSSVVLQVTTGSSQNLVWSGSVNNTWQVSGAANWNGGTATYLEYGGGTGDLVTFDDTAGGTINISGTVKPAIMTVSNSSAFHTFSGSGGISGPTGIDKQGSSTLTLSTSNSFTGNLAITGGTVFADNNNALGATNGTVSVSGPANTLAIGTPFGSGVTISGKSVTITGTGVGGSRGALRAANGNNNVWAGPVTIGGELTRIGAEDNCKLEVAGPISDGGNNYRLLLRPGLGSTVKISSVGSSYGITRTFTTTGLIQLGANNALSTNGLELGPGTLDLNGFNQTVNLLNDDSIQSPNGPGTILNNGASPATLTINNVIVGSQSGATLADGSAVLNLVKSGSFRHTITNACTYTGTTTVNGGDLRVNGPLGALGNTTITVSSNGTLSGNGAFSSPIIVQAGGTFAPGDGNGLISGLTNSSTLTFNAGSTNLFEIDCATTNADVAAASSVTYGGQLAIIRLGGPLAVGQTFKLFAAGASSGNFANAASVPIENSGGAVGSFNPATGQFTITALTGVSTTPTNITYVRTGGTVDLSWPASHLGWTIQSNSVGLLATNSWFPIAGSASVTNLTITVSPALTNVFFRMVYP